MNCGMQATKTITTTTRSNVKTTRDMMTASMKQEDKQQQSRHILPTEVIDMIISQLAAADLATLHVALNPIGIINATDDTDMHIVPWRAAVAHPRTWSRAHLIVASAGYASSLRDVVSLAASPRPITQQPHNNLISHETTTLSQPLPPPSTLPDSLILSSGHLSFVSLPPPGSLDVRCFRQLQTIDLARVSAVDNDALLAIVRSNLTQLRVLRLAGCRRLSAYDTTPGARSYVVARDTIVDPEVRARYRPVLRRRFLDLSTVQGLAVAASKPSVTAMLPSPVSPSTITTLADWHAHARANDNDDDANVDLVVIPTTTIIDNNEDSDDDNDDDIGGESETPLLLSLHNALPALEELDISFTRIGGRRLCALRDVLAHDNVLRGLRVLDVGYQSAAARAQDWDAVLRAVNRRHARGTMHLKRLGLTAAAIAPQTLALTPPIVDEVDLRDCPQLTRVDCTHAAAAGARVVCNCVLADHSRRAVAEYIHSITTGNIVSPTSLNTLITN